MKKVKSLVSAARKSNRSAIRWRRYGNWWQAELSVKQRREYMGMARVWANRGNQ